jgi:Zn-finger nucleic acid-binding protein
MVKMFKIFKNLFKNKIETVHDEELLTCPRCHIKMEKLKKNDVIIDVCKKCNGMWLDDGEIQKLAEMSNEGPVEVSKEDKKLEEVKGDKDGEEI